jgi:phosphatidylinositol alpha-1,6-mannosyltransferase
MPPSKSGTLNLVVDQRFLQSPNGAVWSHSPPAYPFFEQALEVFDRVRLIARTSAISVTPANARRVDGPAVEVMPVPSFVGPFQYLRKRSAVSATLDRIARLDGAFLLRIPSQTAFLIASRLDHLHRPYAVELLTDPHDFFAPGVSAHGLAYLFRPYFCRRSRETCARSVAANFVTGSRTLAAHPTPRALWNGNVSDVDLPAEAFPTLSRRRPDRPLAIVTVGFLDLLYKGQDLLIRSLATCHRQGLDFRLSFVGDGENRPRLLALASSLGIGGRVHITGPLGGPTEVRAHLEQSDLFVLPSRAEGIPRALLEAMAAGLPAICSNVGAMPDLLPSRWVIPASDEAALGAKLMEFAKHRDLWPELGAQNQLAARAFERSILRPQRKAFYEAVHNGCQLWSLPGEIPHAA